MEKESGFSPYAVRSTKWLTYHSLDASTVRAKAQYHQVSQAPRLKPRVNISFVISMLG